ncbi:MAG: transcription antitermination factor NusB [Kiritimatiellae bacterium]|nr:transcription antitermination factor NusB [Kiritimatiellia bacterium]
MSKKQKVRVTRRQAREWALQMLCLADLNPGEDLDSMIETFWNEMLSMKREEEEERALDAARNPLSVIRWEEAETPRAKSSESIDHVCPPPLRVFAETRVRGVVNDLAAIDKAIEQYAEHWAVYRMGTVERNVLRLAYFELRDCPDVPAPVVLNEAIDLAKYFSNTNAGRFVNGILDKMRLDLRKEEAGKPRPLPKKR